MLSSNLIRIRYAYLHTESTLAQARASTSTEYVLYRALVGQAVAGRRARLKLQQKDLADALGITQASWSRLETGQSAFSVEQLSQASAALGTSAGEILAEADRVATQLAHQGYKVLRNPKEVEDDWRPVGAVVLVGLLLALAFNGKK